MDIFQILFNSLMGSHWAHHLYADDAQIYLELDCRKFDSNPTELANCLEAIQVWMGNSKLKLNRDKTVMIKSEAP